MRPFHVAAVTFLSTQLIAAALLATTRNGTYQGRYLQGWDQDLFLGIPYAQPPVGELRFRWPQSLNTSFDDIHDASEYGYSCMQYHTNFNLSEDCLNLNVIRPSGNYTKLPVLLWIFGGGLYTGSTADPQVYNPGSVVSLLACLRSTGDHLTLILFPNPNVQFYGVAVRGAARSSSSYPYDV